MEMSHTLSSPTFGSELAGQLGQQTVVLIGMMGAGKSSVGRRLASRLQVPFVDADTEIETAANQKISDMFDQFGEDYFRQGEKRVIARLLDEGPQVLATGGGAYMDDETRALVGEKGISVYIDAPLELLMSRVRRRSNRPLLKTADPEATMRELLDKRVPIYSTADICVRSRDVPHSEVVDDIVDALDRYISQRGARV
jgi:shikimate kinase